MSHPSERANDTRTLVELLYANDQVIEPMLEFEKNQKHYERAVNIFEHVSRGPRSEAKSLLQAEAAAVADYRGAQCDIPIEETNDWHEESTRILASTEKLFGGTLATLPRITIGMLHARSLVYRSVRGGVAHSSMLHASAETACREARAAAELVLGELPTTNRLLADIVTQHAVFETMRPYSNTTWAMRLGQQSLLQAKVLSPVARQNPKHLFRVSDPVVASRAAMLVIHAKAPAQISLKASIWRSNTAIKLLG